MPQSPQPSQSPEPKPGTGPGPVSAPAPQVPPQASAGAAQATAGRSAHPVNRTWVYTPPPQADWLRLSTARPAEPARIRVVGAAVASGLVGATVLGDGFGVNLLLCALAGTVGAALTAFGTGRTVKPWHLAFALTALLLCAVPAVSDSAGATLLAAAAAVCVGSLALHGGTRWAGVALGSLGLWAHFLPGLAWGIGALKHRRFPARSRVVPVLKAAVVSLVLLLVFGSLFAGADSTVGELLQSLVPSFAPGEVPLRAVLFAGGALLALGAAHTAAAPRRWDRVPTKPGKERGRLEWAMPLVVLNLLFGTFVAVQVVVLVDGYGSIIARTGMTPAEYARQGFWQLLWITVLTLVVVAFAKYWAPRGNDGDRRLVKALLGLLCTLALVVVGTALVRMSLYVDAFGLTRLRVNVAAVEIWLGLVLLLVLFGSVLSSRRWLPRAVVLSAALAVAAFGLLRTDGLIAEQNVERRTAVDSRIDIDYLRGLSLDAVPALDRLPGDQRTCALQTIADELAATPAPPWYAISGSEARARQILADRPVTRSRGACARIGVPELYRTHSDG